MSETTVTSIGSTVSTVERLPLIVMRKGDQFTLDFTLTDSEDNPVDLTGKELTCNVNFFRASFQENPFNFHHTPIEDTELAADTLTFNTTNAAMGEGNVVIPENLYRGEIEYNDNQNGAFALCWVKYTDTSKIPNDKLTSAFWVLWRPSG